MVREKIIALPCRVRGIVKEIKGERQTDKDRKTKKIADERREVEFKIDQEGQPQKNGENDGR